MQLQMQTRVAGAARSSARPFSTVRPVPSIRSPLQQTAARSEERLQCRAAGASHEWLPSSFMARGRSLGVFNPATAFGCCRGGRCRH
jgi:hypothetical protein